jgi:hypothetical protein
MVEGRQVDWAMAEAMAFGSLLKEGIHVRQADYENCDKFCINLFVSLMIGLIRHVEVCKRILEYSTYQRN